MKRLILIAAILSSGAHALTCEPLPNSAVRVFRAAVGSTLEGIEKLVHQDSEGEFAIPGDRALAIHRLTEASLRAADGEGAGLRLEVCLTSGPRDASCFTSMNDYLRLSHGLSNLLQRAIECGEVDQNTAVWVREVTADLARRANEVVQQTITSLNTNVESNAPAGHASLCGALETRLRFERGQRAIRNLMGVPNSTDDRVTQTLEDLSRQLCST